MMMMTTTTTMLMSTQVPHAETLQPYLVMRMDTKRDQWVLCQVIRILEKAIPLMDHPGDNFLSKVEDGGGLLSPSVDERSSGLSRKYGFPF